jgi:hypothetical protein
MNDDTPRCVIEAAHARWVEEARQAIMAGRLSPNAARRLIVRVAGLDPDGPLEPMRPAPPSEMARLEAAVSEMRHACRDAALIAALRWT